MIEGSSGESDVSGEAPSIRLTISRIFNRFQHFYRLADISVFLNEGFFILPTHPSPGQSSFRWLFSFSFSSPNRSRGRTWSATTRSPSSRFGLVKSQRFQQTNFIRWQTSLWMRTLPLSLWRHNMSLDTGDSSILKM